MMKAFIRGFFATLLVIALVVGFMVWTSHMRYVSETQVNIELSLFLATIAILMYVATNDRHKHNRGKYER